MKQALVRAGEPIKGIGLTFSSGMMHRIRDGRKTMTRRLWTQLNGRHHRIEGSEAGTPLWTRERLLVTATGICWAADSIEFWRPDMAVVGDPKTVWWESRGGGVGGDGGVVEAMYQPWWCSRYHMRLADWRVERLQDITEADAMQEGVVAYQPRGFGAPRYGVADKYGFPAKFLRNGAGEPEPLAFWSLSALSAYGRLWDALHTRDGARWHDNPEVAVIVWDWVWAMWEAVSPAPAPKEATCA